jgi:sialate O-acetylesterase
LTRAACIVALAGLAVLSASAEVSLPALLSEHVVLQRRTPIHIWGKAAAGEAVSVTFRGQTRSAVADDLGRWSAYLPPSEAGGPFTLAVSATNTITLQDVMVGEVWVDSGQSNMEFSLRGANNGEAEVAAANHPKIRLIHVNKKVSALPVLDADARPWEVCTPQTAPGFSAAAYFFARDLDQKLGVPIGLIDSNWGGTPVEAWMSLRALSSDAQFMPAFAWWWNTIGDPVPLVRRDKRKQDWLDAAAKAQAAGQPRPPDLPFESNMENSWMPGGLYNAMIAPLTGFPIGGVIWYQGEQNANAEGAPLYNGMFSAMIRDWRKAWGVGDFPFLFVQLANFTAPNGRWPELRDAQRQTLAVARTGMAVTIDIGEARNIHPRNKQDVGKRLALAARAIAYGENIEYSGPVLRTAVREDGSIRLWFDHAAGLQSKSGDLKGFQVAGADRKFEPAVAVIEGTTISVSSPAVAHPLYVRYAWADNPECNLYNGEGLPASPFRWGE